MVLSLNAYVMRSEPSSAVKGGGEGRRGDNNRPATDCVGQLAAAIGAGLMRWGVRLRWLLFVFFRVFAVFAALGAHFGDFLFHFLFAFGVEFLFVGFEFMEQA